MRNFTKVLNLVTMGRVNYLTILLFYFLQAQYGTLPYPLPTWRHQITALIRLFYGI